VCQSVVSAKSFEMRVMSGEVGCPCDGSLVCVASLRMVMLLSSISSPMLSPRVSGEPVGSQSGL
jgi:hypothetical protein